MFIEEYGMTYHVGQQKFLGTELLLKTYAKYEQGISCKVFCQGKFCGFWSIYYKEGSWLVDVPPRDDLLPHFDKPEIIEGGFYRFTLRKDDAP
jgi:hypothetical protein